MKFLKLFIVLLILSLSSNTSFANNKVSLGEAFIFFAESYKDSTPASFNYIKLEYKGIPKNSKLEDALQTLVYHNKIQNVAASLATEKDITVYNFERLALKIANIQVGGSTSEAEKKQLILTSSDLENVQKILERRKNRPTITVNTQTPSVLWKKWKILEDVYTTLSKWHYERKNLDKDKLIESAIIGLTEGTKDKYTNYFPPTESKDFFTTLDGEFEWIGAYVEMHSPWSLTIVSPIVGSPAEAAGIKGWDIITHVDEKAIEDTHSLREVISWIKWPAWTTVKLTIKRGEEILKIDVKRAKIVIKDVEYKTLRDNTAYIQIKNFGEKVDNEFRAALQEVKKNSSTKKIIFDLRNNPGGYLGKVSDILWYFIPKWEHTAIVSSGKKDVPYLSNGKNILDLNSYEVIILQNGGSASASEIFIGSLKDYFPHIKTIGEKTFGKGSVQTLKQYYDGSTLKYTTAKWYTGKSRTGIDGVGIQADIELEFDEKRWKDLNNDNQLERALDE